MLLAVPLKHFTVLGLKSFQFSFGRIKIIFAFGRTSLFFGTLKQVLKVYLTLILFIVPSVVSSSFLKTKKTTTPSCFERNLSPSLNF